MDKIAVIDFGSQFTHLLANRIRNLGVYSEILDPETPLEDLRAYKGLVLSGGPASVNAPGAPMIDPKIYELGIPVLGVCYGHQLTMKILGGTVDKGQVGEYGLTQFEVLKSTGHMSEVPTGMTTVYASHFDAVTKLPEGFEVLGRTPDDAYAATANQTRRIYTLQFHPEVTHTAHGIAMIDGFLKITGASRDWDMSKFLDMEMQKVRAQVGDRNVFMLVSGGVDSTVAYALLEKALGKEHVYALFVDTGFMRKNESAAMTALLAQAGIDDLHIVDAGEQFFSALAGVTEPEAKRKIIGDMFLQVQRETVAKLNMDPEHWLLGQGTIYPDTIESGGTKNADKIKTHHNRVPEIEAMIAAGKVIEPLKELYKDEVRAVGRKLGLASALVDRHPFPGPGLAVRSLCSTGPVGETIVEGSNWLLPIRSVGVQGDERTYRQPVLLGTEFTDWESLRKLSVQTTNSDKRCNRVLLKVALKSGNTVENVEVLPATETRERIAMLQEADALVTEALQELDPTGLVWQFPVVLLPLSLNKTGSETIVLRPISSENGMTANVTELSWSKIQELAQKILKIDGISAVLYDLTNKPPATIEWE